MNKMELLTTALEYIESHLSADIKTEDAAKACYCSKAALEKLFRNLNHMSVHDYVIRRRMTLAARMLAEKPEMSVLDVALTYGYSTNESFSRAFKKVWDCNPSEFRENPSHFALFPRLHTPLQRDGESFTRKNVDISELYELFQSRRNCYFVCCDVERLLPINAIAHKAGDMAILEALHRMEQEAGEEDVVFRIGGDEFALITNKEDSGYAEGIADRIRSYNGMPIVYNGLEIPVALHIAVTKLSPEDTKQKEMFDGLLHALWEVKEAEE